MDPAKSRTRNRRGEGGRLREEIVHAALELIDGGGPEAATLRAVARQAGISAPSIYSHFADLDQILGAVSDQCFRDLSTALTAARDSEADPVRRLLAGSRAYLDYAERHPQRYALLFRVPDLAAPTSAASAEGGAIAFKTLVDGIAECVASGRSVSTDPFSDAVALWSGLHGFAGLVSTETDFTWPDRDDVARRIVIGLARITD